MLRKGLLKTISALMCGCVIMAMMSLEVWAKDDNPSGANIAEFPTALEIERSDSVMTCNYGTISQFKAGGLIYYNYGTIDSSAGSLLENRGIVKEVGSGRVDNNYGTINKIDNTGSVGTNTPDGVIDINFNNIEKNMGTINNQVGGTIEENQGNIGTLSAGAKIQKFIDGVITENNGEVTITPSNILTTPKIVNNKGVVVVEADSGNKSSVIIENNSSTVIVNDGADCTVINNTGTITVNGTGVCNLTGTNNGTCTGNIAVPEGAFLELKLDYDESLSDLDFTPLDNFKVEDGKIKVKKDAYVRFTINEKLYRIPWSEADNPKIHRINISDWGWCHIEGTTFVLHIHKIGEYVSTVEGKHHAKCVYESICEDTATIDEDCFGGTATCTDKAVCDLCHNPYGTTDSDNHEYTAEWSKDQSAHWKTCVRSGCPKATEKLLSASHTYGDWITDTPAAIGVAGTKHRVCSVCSYREDGTIPALTDPQGGDPQGGDPQGGNPQGGDPQGGDPQNNTPGDNKPDAGKNNKKTKTDNTVIKNDVSMNEEAVDVDSGLAKEEIEEEIKEETKEQQVISENDSDKSSSEEEGEKEQTVKEETSGEAFVEEAKDIGSLKDPQKTKGIAGLAIAAGILVAGAVGGALLVRKRRK